MTTRQLTLSIKLCLSAALIIILFPNFVSAQTNSVTSIKNPNATLSAQVTATVPDRQAPSVPILIKPDNGSVVTNPQPTFQWIGSTDNVEINHYEFWLNGSLKIDKVPLSSTQFPNASITVDQLTNTFKLTLVNNLPDGIYSWHVYAVDTSGNKTISAVWTFIIDTTPPTLIIKRIDDEWVEISSLDPNSVPTDPFVVSTHSPLIAGVTEPNTLLQVIIGINGNEERHLIQVDQDGNWKLQLNNLPVDTIISLTFINTDQNGHIAIIQSLLLIYREAKQPHQPSPTKGIPFLNPTPTVIPGIVISPYPSPTPQNNKQFFPWLITPINATNQFRLTSILRDASNGSFISFFNIIIMILPTGLAILISMYYVGWLGHTWSWQLIFWLIGWREKFSKDGRVIDQENDQGVWLTTVVITHTSTDPFNYKQENNKKIYFTITNRDGFFILPNLPENDYQLRAIGSHLIFPTIIRRNNNEAWNRYYQGEVIKKESNKALPYIEIPVDILKSRSLVIREIFISSSWEGWIVKFQLIMMFFVFALSPSYINLMAIISTATLITLFKRKEVRNKYDQYLGLK